MMEVNNRDNRERRENRYESKAISIRRVAKVTSGGKRLRFSAMVVVGDKKGSVGVALGRGVDTRSAIEKATRKAEKVMKRIEIVGDTIPHELYFKNGASKLLLRPAKPGTGVIAGSSVRTVLELCGIENVYGKVLGSGDLIGNAYCTFEALKKLKSGRVLSKMSKMRDRISLKSQLDEERKTRELRLKRKNQAKEGNKSERNQRDRKHTKRSNIANIKAEPVKKQVEPEVKAPDKETEKAVNKK